MQYVLVRDRQFILLGPIEWRARFIQSELNDLGIDYTVPQTEPASYLKINDNIEIFTATVKIPNHDPIYEELEGPYWNFDNNFADGWYYPRNKNLEHAKGALKNIAAAERYKKEIAGTKLTINGTEISVDTSREGRALYNQQLASMSTSTSIDWKFPEAWLTLSKTNMNAIVTGINTFIQDQFTWEKSISDAIDTATSREELTAITIVEPITDRLGVI